MRREERLNIKWPLFAKQYACPQKVQLACGFVRIQGAFGRRIHCGEVAAAICVARMRNRL